MSRICLFIIAVVFAHPELAMAEPKPILKSDPEEFCEKTVPNIGFKFFDRSWRNDEWEASRKRLITKCQNWKQNKQDSQLLSDLVLERDLFAQRSMLVRDKMVAVTIQLLGSARDQASTPLCYAHAIADVVSYHSGQAVSVFSVMLRSFQQLGGIDAFRRGLENSSGRYSNGNLSLSTAQGVLSRTLCRDDQNREHLTYNGEDLAQIWDAYQNKYRAYIGPQAPTELYSQIERSLARIAPGLSASDFISHISRYKPMDEALGEWIDRQCNIKLSGGAQVVVKSSDYAKAIDEALDAGTIAALVYHSKVIQRPGARHASLIVGKVTIEGVSHYLLRNSWGSDCGKYEASMVARCKLGHIWLTESEIKDNSSLVVYINGLR